MHECRHALNDGLGHDAYDFTLMLLIWQSKGKKWLRHKDSFNRDFWCGVG